MLPKAYADALNSTPHPIPIAHAAQPTERGHQVLLLCLCTPVHYSDTFAGAVLQTQELLDIAQKPHRSNVEYRHRLLLADR
jgi:hypothetical protein